MVGAARHDGAGNNDQHANDCWPTNMFIAKEHSEYNSNDGRKESSDHAAHGS
jgi:hypothetical protein